MKYDPDPPFGPWDIEYLVARGECRRTPTWRDLRRIHRAAIRRGAALGPVPISVGIGAIILWWLLTC